MIKDDFYAELVLEATIDGGCNLIVSDKTDYASKGFNDMSKHGILEFVCRQDIDKDLKVVWYNIAPFLDNYDRFIRESAPYPITEDGYYVYRRMVLPLEDEDGPFINVEDGEVYDYVNGVATKVESTNYTNLYEKSHEIGAEILIGEDCILATCQIRKCLYKYQKDSIDAIVKNGCDFTCRTGIDTYRRDFLLSAMLVLDYYEQTGEITKALQLLKRLHACGGICNDDADISNCGCGGK